MFKACFYFIFILQLQKGALISLFIRRNVTSHFMDGKHFFIEGLDESWNFWSDWIT